LTFAPLYSAHVAVVRPFVNEQGQASRRGLCTATVLRGGDPVNFLSDLKEASMRITATLKKAACIAACATALLSVDTAMASTLNYTFSGVGTGTVSGLDTFNFTDAPFSFLFIENPTALQSFGPGSYYTYYSGIGGIFTEGNYSAIVTGAEIEVNGNANTGVGAYETVVLFNSDLSGSLVIGSDPALFDYLLATPIDTGTITGNQLGVSAGDGFSSLFGDTITFTGLDSLDFAVTAPQGPPTSSATPEPSSWLLLTTGVSGMGLLRRRIAGRISR
jgi:hypothetical protein